MSSTHAPANMFVRVFFMSRPKCGAASPAVHVVCCHVTHMRYALRNSACCSDMRAAAAVPQHAGAACCRIAIRHAMFRRLMRCRGLRTNATRQSAYRRVAVTASASRRSAHAERPLSAAARAAVVARALRGVATRHGTRCRYTPAESCREVAVIWSSSRHPRGGGGVARAMPLRFCFRHPPPAACPPPPPRATMFFVSACRHMPFCCFFAACCWRFRFSDKFVAATPRAQRLPPAPRVRLLVLFH